MTDYPSYKITSVADLVPYARNSRTHSAQQIDKIAASIREFGFLSPVIIDGQSGIIAGHGRVLAAQKLGLPSLPVIEASHLTDAQRRAYVIADNRLALDAGWDDEMLRIELRDLEDVGFDLTLTGFELEEMGDLFDLSPDKDHDDAGLSENYSRKIEAPIYEITGKKPEIFELFDKSKTKTLQDEIASSEIPDEVKIFLHEAAERHTVFNFRNIAEFYAHSDSKIQNLMERSALVIIDFKRAIEEGFVHLSKELLDMESTDEG